jgi:hypothetical protein
MQFESWIKNQELIESSQYINITNHKIPSSNIFGLDHKINGFTIVDRKYTEDESLPTFMLSNITPITTDIDYNLERIRTIAKLAKSLKVNILVFPELPISGYV